MMALTQLECAFLIFFTHLPLFESKIATDPSSFPEATYLYSYSFQLNNNLKIIIHLYIIKVYR